MKVTVENSEVIFDLSPAELANYFSKQDDRYQAKFIDILAYQFNQWGNKDRNTQLLAIGRRLEHPGREEDS